MELFLNEIIKVKTIFEKKRIWRISFLTSVSKHFETKFTLKKVLQDTIPKNMFVFSSWFGEIVTFSKVSLHKTICGILTFVSLIVIFRTKTRFSCKFMFKDKISYEYMVHVSELMGVSAHTSKSQPKILLYRILCYNIVSFKEFFVSVYVSNDFRKDL